MGKKPYRSGSPGRRQGERNWKSWEEYIKLDEAEQRRAKVVFLDEELTDLDRDGTLGVEPEAGGDSA